jgi:hypothetical protein
MAHSIFLVPSGNALMPARVTTRKVNQQPKNLWTYCRKSAPEFAADDPELTIKLDQWRKLESFFTTFTNPNGSFAGGFNPYETPDDFRKQFENHLRDRLDELLETL